MSSSSDKPSTIRGPRTGITAPPLGKVPLDPENSDFEDMEEFWKATKTPQKPSKKVVEDPSSSSSSSLSDNDNNSEPISQEVKPSFDNLEDEEEEEDEEEMRQIAKSIVARQRRKARAGLLSPGAESVATEATELTAIQPSSVASKKNIVRHYDDEEEEEEELSLKGDDQDNLRDVTSPLLSPATENNSKKSKSQLDTLMEEDGDDKDEDVNVNSEPAADTNYDDGGFGGDDEGGFGGNMDDDSQDDDNEQGGFNLLNDEETPEKEREAREKEERRKLKEEKRKKALEAAAEKKKKKKKKRSTDDSVSFASPISINVPAGPRSYNAVPISDFKDEPDSDDDERQSLRRSKRARMPVLAWWKNERVIYGPSEPGEFKNNPSSKKEDEEDYDMPVPRTANLANPTPMKKYHVERGKSKETSKESGKSAPKEKKIKPYDAKKLNKKYAYKTDEDEAVIWDEGLKDLTERKVVSRYEDMTLVDLPVMKKRMKGESKLSGKAVQAFNVLQVADNIPGWISGRMVLPPKGIKDAENVGICSQIFFVGDCQPNAFEVAIANPEEDDFEPKTAQRFLLKKDDFFQVPPNNIYRVENHSETESAVLNWVIVRPTKPT